MATAEKATPRKRRAPTKKTSAPAAQVIESKPEDGKTDQPEDDAIGRILDQHGPSDWKKKGSVDLLKKHLNNDVPLRMVILAADIRRSTFLMKESVRFGKFAEAMGAFVEDAARIVRKADGWFDKFTGDGFLAYWLWDEDAETTSIASNLFAACHSLLYRFQDVYMDTFRRNSKNFPSNVGLSLGLDAGPTYFVTVADDLTVVGSPVVGAVRMVSAAGKPWESVCNVYLGEWLYRNRSKFLDADVTIQREYRPTKEYESQEVYTLSFHKAVGAIIPNP